MDESGVAPLEAPGRFGEAEPEDDGAPESVVGADRGGHRMAGADESSQCFGAIRIVGQFFVDCFGHDAAPRRCVVDFVDFEADEGLLGA